MKKTKNYPLKSAKSLKKTKIYPLKSAKSPIYYIINERPN